ncbi:alkaline shock response membrane anchor protein AmaP [Corynebacterium pyruviciproducens]|uniref:alkaline shock response membrane anchor protein AmaP n=1 Tax=Corynebacterium pyruviciproducens TaxID=598660 RepID=UPI0023EFBC3E|nr:alkaline shock response membrane anchor protein AmaP [Corynebacterium pyruviciproducens]
MNKGLAAFNRTLSFIGFLLFALVGALLIGLHFNNEYAQYVTEWADQDAWRTLTDSPWYPWLLGLLGVVALLIGLWLILSNFTRKTINKVPSSASNQDGNISLALGRVADAVAESFEDIPFVENAGATVKEFRDRPVMDVTITADPRVNSVLIRERIEQANLDLREAIRDVDVDTRFRVHMQQIQRATD